MKLRVIAVLVAAVAVAGCSDSPTPPVVGFNGALSFTYTGGGGGTHSANGDFTTITSTNLYTAPWAYGVRSDAEVVVGVVSNQPRTLTTHDLTVIAINRLTPGTASFSATCDPDVETACTGMVFYRGQSNTFATYEFFCILTSGTVNLSALSATRAQGTFSGSGFCFDSADNSQPFTVTGGTFDVAVLSESQLPSE